jgi:phosphatidyl-myo-inositol dimannoside synthase
MNILIVAQNYHPYVGGVETQTRMVAHELSREHRVEVAATNFLKASLPSRLGMLEDSLLIPSFDSYDDEGVRVHSLAPGPKERLRMLPVLARALPRVQRHYFFELRRFGYRHFRAAMLPRLRELVRGRDVVHSVASNYLGWAAQEAARLEGVPFVLTPYVHPGQHGDDADSVAFFNRSDAVFALIETDREKLTDLGVDRDRVRISGVVPLLPETSDPAGFRARHGLGEKPFVLFLGRVVAYKGARALIDAARTVWQKIPDAHFLFAGPAGDEEKAWFEDADDTRIRYLGLVSEQEKADALAACDLFSMPSTHEILPAVYLEAWTYGKPVLGGKAHGLPELIEGNGAGVTVEQDPEAVAVRVIEMLTDRDASREMGERGQALVRKRYSREALVGTLLATYEAAAGLESIAA